MKQVVLRGGAPTIADVPAPSPVNGQVLVANAASLISSGTERAAVSASGGGGSLPMRAIRNPDLVLLTLKHAREHGVRDTVEAVRNAVSDDTVLGYSSAGVVLHTGGIADFRVGQHVACAGAGRANHAEVVSVPGNLVAPVPEGVPLRDAAFTTVGAIALQGVRRAEAAARRAGGRRRPGAHRAHHGPAAARGGLSRAGRRAVGRAPRAGGRAGRRTGRGARRRERRGQGVDGRHRRRRRAGHRLEFERRDRQRRGRHAAAQGPRSSSSATWGSGLERGPIYQREADFLISTSYGPGRYDPTYEEGGLDYPIAYVRWTENRNMEEFLRLLSTGAVRVEPLVELELPADRAAEAYERVNSDPPPLAAVLTYDPERAQAGDREVVRISSRRGDATGDVTVGLVGPGSFVRSVHLPNLRADEGVRIKTVVTRRSTTATDIVRSLRITGEAATDWRVAVEDPEIDLVVIGTRHDSHAEIAAAALRAGRAVFVEKPLGLTRDEIDDVWAAGRDNDRLAIGFNRPFAPLAQRLHAGVEQADGPLHVVYRVNAPLAADHWLNDPRVGGGRILGEACHMIDFANWLCGTPIRVMAAALPAPPTVGSVESATITVEYANGSVATVLYSGVGAGAMPKERVEVLRGGRSWVLDDFRALTAWGAGGEETEAARAQDKGHAELMRRVLAACRGRQGFEPGLEAAYSAQSVALTALDSIASAAVVEVPMAGDGS